MLEDDPSTKCFGTLLIPKRSQSVHILQRPCQICSIFFPFKMHKHGGFLETVWASLKEKFHVLFTMTPSFLFQCKLDHKIVLIPGTCPMNG